MFQEESLIYFPDRYPIGQWNPPGLEFEDADFESADGTRLHGWYAEAADPVAVILFSHGNAGNITHRACLLELLRARFRASLLLYDYRGYGKSDGSPTEKGILADARAARRWLAHRAGVGEKDVVLMGRSLGGAVAVDLAAGDPVRGLILESTFTSMPDVAAYHYPLLPVRMLMRTRFDSLSKIGRYRGPLLQSHGTADEIIPFELGRRLFDAAAEPKEFVALDGAMHNDPQPEEYYQALRRFLESLA